MSWIQQQEELAYDTQTEYLAVLRQEHHDYFENDHSWCLDHDWQADYSEPDAWCPSCIAEAEARAAADPQMPAVDPWAAEPPF